MKQNVASSLDMDFHTVWSIIDSQQTHGLGQRSGQMN